MSSRTLRAMLLGSLISLGVAGSAAAAEFKARADVPFDSGVFSSEPSAEIRREGLKAAKLAAWKRYTATFNAARTKIYNGIADEVTADLDPYIIDAVVLGESLDKNANLYSVAVRISVNEAAFEARLNEAGGGGAAAGGSGMGEMFSFVFVAREVESVKSFDARRVQVTKQESQAAAEEQASVRGNSVAAASNSTSMTQTATGGSTLRKADDVAYRVSSGGDIDAAMSDVLTTAGFEVVNYPDVYETCGGAPMEVIREEFSSSDALDSKTRMTAVNGARDCDVAFFAMGTMDVGMHDIDSVSGNQRVHVSVRGQVWDIRHRLPRKVASVGPVMYAGLGPDPEVAKRNALILAAKEGAKAISDQLSAKGVR